MAVEYDPNGIPILSGESMLSDVPAYTQELAPKLVNSRGEDLSTISDLVDSLNSSAGGSSIYLGNSSQSLGNVAAGASGPYHAVAVAFNGEVGDVWTAQFSASCGLPPGGTPINQASCKIKLATNAGIPLYQPGDTYTTSASTNGMSGPATYTWKATAASDYLLVWITANDYGVGNLTVYASGLINHGQLASSRRQMLKEQLADRRERNA